MKQKSLAAVERSLRRSRDRIHPLSPASTAPHNPLDRGVLPSGKMRGPLSPESNRSRVFWPSSNDKALLDIMVEEVHRGGREGSGFKREAWRTMLVRFNNKLNLNYDVQQLKNRFKYIRNQYNAVRSILSQSGFCYDTITHTITAREEVWNDYITRCPNAAAYKNKPLPLYEQWAVICGPVSPGDSIPYVPVDDNGMGGVSPHVFNEMNGGVDSGGQFEDSEHSLEDDYDEDDDDDDEGFKDQPMKRQATVPLTSPRHGSKGRQRKADGLQEALNNIAEASMLRARMRAEARKEKWPLNRCITELRAIQGLDEELFVKALVAFRDEYNRSVFLLIDGEYRLAWLRAICRQVVV